jgi:hypothetical protein
MTDESSGDVHGSSQLITDEELAELESREVRFKEILSRLEQIAAEARSDAGFVARVEMHYADNLEMLDQEDRTRYDSSKKALEDLEAESEALQEEADQIKATIGGLATLKEIQDKVAGYAPMIEVGMRLLSIAPQHATPVIKAILAATQDVADNLEPELDRAAMLMAKSMRRKYDALVKVGFEPDQAMRIVLAQVKPSSIMDSVGEVIDKTDASTLARGASLLK